MKWQLQERIVHSEYMPSARRIFRCLQTHRTKSYDYERYQKFPSHRGQRFAHLCTDRAVGSTVGLLSKSVLSLQPSIGQRFVNPYPLYRIPDETRAISHGPLFESRLLRLIYAEPPHYEAIYVPMSSMYAFPEFSREQSRAGFYSSLTTVSTVSLVTSTTLAVVPDSALADISLTASCTTSATSMCSPLI